MTSWFLDFPYPFANLALTLSQRRSALEFSIGVQFMKTRSGLIPFLLGLSFVSFAVTASAIPIGNIVKNGGFETGSLPPWQTSGTTGSAARTNAASNGVIGLDQDSAHTGNFGLFAGASGGKVFLQQSLQTTVGSSYILSFWMDGNQSEGLRAASSGNPIDFEVFWNGKLIFDTSDVPNSYTKFTFTDLPATGSRTNLKFGFRDDFGFFHLDDIKAGLVGVPEAFSTIWLALPLVMLLFGARIRMRSLA
jgi:hypothetical protein